MFLLFMLKEEDFLHKNSVVISGVFGMNSYYGP